MDSDRKIIQKVLLGETQYFAELIQRYESRIFKTCCRFVGNSQDAEDIAQEVFLTIYKNLGQYKEYSKFSTWVYRITVNACLNFLRKKDKLVLQYDDQYSSASTIGNPELMLEAKEIKKLLEFELDCVGKKNGQIFLYRIKYAMPFKRIADKTGITAAAARMSFSRTKKRLETKVQSYFKGESSHDLQND
jgi:RNA polymerase sigma factor (sigma-70 family)